MQTSDFPSLHAALAHVGLRAGEGSTPSGKKPILSSAGELLGWLDASEGWALVRERLAVSTDGLKAAPSVPYLGCTLEAVWDGDLCQLTIVHPGGRIALRAMEPSAALAIGIRWVEARAALLAAAEPYDVPVEFRFGLDGSLRMVVVTVDGRRIGADDCRSPALVVSLLEQLTGRTPNGPWVS